MLTLYTIPATKETVNIEDLVDDFATYYVAGDHEPCFSHCFHVFNQNVFHTKIMLDRLFQTFILFRHRDYWKRARFYSCIAASTPTHSRQVSVNIVTNVHVHNIYTVIRGRM